MATQVAILTREETWRRLVGMGLVNGSMPTSAFDLRTVLIPNGTHFNGFNLNDALLNGKRLQEVSFQGTSLMRASFEGSELNGCMFQNAIMREAILSNAILTNCNLERALLVQANLEGIQAPSSNFDSANLAHSNLKRADLRSARLQSANISDADLRNADLSTADLEGAYCIGADVRGAKMAGANFERANVTGVSYDRKGTFAGIRISTAYGNPLFVRHAQDEDYIDTYRKNHKYRYWLWKKSTDCGRSLGRISLVGLGIILSFGFLFSLFPQHFIIHGLEDGKKLTWFTYYYYSIVTFSTLGYGDVSAKTLLGEILVAIEVILGYVVLGLLVSILANKVARRS